VGFEGCKERDCPNWGLVLLDANVVRYALRAAVESLKELNAAGNTWDQLAPRIIDDFSNNVGILSRCSHDGNLRTSEIIQSIELNVAHLKESARPFDNSDPVLDNSTIRELSRLAMAYFSEAPFVDPKENIQMRALLSQNGVTMLDRDASLLIAGLKLDNGTVPIIIVSSDGLLVDAGYKMRELPTVSLNGHEYATQNLCMRTYAAFVTEVHGCCKCQSDVYSYLFNAWYFFSLERAQGRPLRPNVKRMYRQSLDAMQKSLRDKGKVTSRVT